MEKKKAPRKFCYTEEDAAGCELRDPDYSICENCVYNDKDFPNYPHACEKYHDNYFNGKPPNVFDPFIDSDKKTCEFKKVAK